MKNLFTYATCALLLGAGVATAQSTSTTTTTTAGGTTTSVTTSSGTLHEYTPGTTFIVKETSGPVTYKYGTTVTYVTKKGKTLTSPACIGVRKLRFIDQSHRSYRVTGDSPSPLYTAAISLNW